MYIQVKPKLVLYGHTLTPFSSKAWKYILLNTSQLGLWRSANYFMLYLYIFTHFVYDFLYIFPFVWFVWRTLIAYCRYVFFINLISQPFTKTSIFSFISLVVMLQVQHCEGKQRSELFTRLKGSSKAE